MTEDDNRKQKFKFIIIAYPLVLIAIGIIINLFGFGVLPMVIALPTKPILITLVISAVLLALNHTWLMTATELTRLNYKMYASPEEWDEKKASPEQVSDEGWRELERHHNAHRNATENTVYFVLLSVVVCIVSPSVLSAQVWIGGFAVARLGYTYCYLKGMSDIRGIFMSMSLLSLYGLASYLTISILL